MRTLFKTVLVFAVFALMFGLLGIAPTQAKTSAQVLQFTAGNNVIGFSPQKIYMASLRQTLIAEFVNANSVMPISATAATGMGKPAELSRVTYPNLWAGITARYERAASGVMKSTYLLAAGADAANIGLRYNAPLKADADGSLLIQLESGAVRESAPIAWQVINGKNIPVTVRFKIIGDRQVGFRLGAYNPRYEVTIDPTYQWHTFFGSAASGDYADSIIVDGSGNVVVAGQSQATFDVGVSTPKNPHAGGGLGDIVVVKMDSSGGYLWHTFFGSTVGIEFATRVDIDSSSNVIVTGSSGATFNVGSATPKHAFAGNTEIVVVKMDSNGNYLWHTFYGGAASSDSARGLIVDGSGNVIVAGTSAAAFSVGITAPKNAYTGSEDIVVIKMDSSGNYLWHTFFGSAGGSEVAWDMGADSSGNMVVAGGGSATFNMGSSAPKNAYAGANDILVIKMDSDGNYLWHTFYGAAATTDTGHSVTVDGSGNVIVAGESIATFDVGAGAPINAHTPAAANNYDIVVVKMDSSGNYLWHTFYGSVVGDGVWGVSTDSNANVVVAGYSPTSFLVGVNAPRNAHAGGDDIVVVKIDSSGNYLWHTFYGSASSDRALGMSVDGNSNVFVTGYSSATFNAGTSAPINTYAGGNDIVVVKLAPPSVTINQAAGQADPATVSPINFTVTFSEPVVGFDTGDVTLTGTAGATTGTVTIAVPNDGTTYNVAVSGMIRAGTVTASVSANVVTDSNLASTSTDNTVTYRIQRLLNGGFNKYPKPTSKIPSSWVAVNFAATDGKSTTVKQEGTASVKIAGAKGKTKTLTQTLSKLSGAKGNAFKFSYWVKASNKPTLGLCQAQVSFYSGTLLKGTKTLKCPTGKTYDWKQVTVNFTAPAAYTSVKVIFTYSKAGGTIWFDAVGLIK